MTSLTHTEVVLRCAITHLPAPFVHVVLESSQFAAIVWTVSFRVCGVSVCLRPNRRMSSGLPAPHASLSVTRYLYAAELAEKTFSIAARRARNREMVRPLSTPSYAPLTPLCV
jgi:hypothetical protein